MKRNAGYWFATMMLATVLVSCGFPMIMRPTSAAVNEIRLEIDDEIRQEPLSTNDSTFGVCYLPPDPSRTHARGLNWRRIDCHWSTVEPSDDAWTWGSYDADVQQSEVNNIYQIVLLCYGNDAITGAGGKYVPPAYLDEWGEYVGEVVRRYRGNETIIAYEVWNEANVEGFWKGSAEDYARLLIKSSEVIRSEDPNALILCTGTASSLQSKLGPNEVFYSRLFEWNQSHPEFKGRIDFDVYNVHAYLNNPVQYRELIRRQKQVCREYNFPWQPDPDSSRFQDRFSRIWVTEIGFGGNSSSPRELNRQQQQTIKAATIGYFENLGHHLIYQWKWDETWVIEGKPVMDAIATIFPIWKNSTPFESFSHVNDFPFKYNPFNLFAARTHDGLLAIAYWDQQEQGYTFDVSLDATISSIDKITLPNFTWPYTMFSNLEGESNEGGKINDILVNHDFQMLLVNSSTMVDSISIITHLDSRAVVIYYLIPGLLVVVMGMVVARLVRRVKIDAPGRR